MQFQLNMLKDDERKIRKTKIVAKGNNSCKNTSNAIKVKVDLYYVKTNPYMEFQVNMSKDDKEKSGKLTCCKGQ